MFPLRLRNCRVIRADDRPEPTHYDEYRREQPIDPAARAEALAARAARSFVAPMTLPPSTGPFAVGDRVNARCERMRTSDRLKWFSGVVERRRGNKYDVLYDDGDRESDLPAAFVRKEGPADGLIIKSYDRSGGEGEGPVVELHVLNTEGRWQPARSLYEYVQQNVVEICSVWDEQNPADAAETSDDDGAPPKWYTASELYERHLHRCEPGDIASLLYKISPEIAGYIVKQRRAEVAGIRILRVAAQRARVPLEVVKHIECFAGLAKDSVPCRRDQLQAFMQRLVEQYVHVYHMICICIKYSVKNGFASDSLAIERISRTRAVPYVSCERAPRLYHSGHRREPKAWISRVIADPWAVDKAQKRTDRP